MMFVQQRFSYYRFFIMFIFVVLMMTFEFFLCIYIKSEICINRHELLHESLYM